MIVTDAALSMRQPEAAPSRPSVTDIASQLDTLLSSVMRRYGGAAGDAGAPKGTRRSARKPARHLDSDSSDDE